MIPGQTEDPSALEVMDILSLLKGGPPTTLNRDGLVYKMISRGQRVRSHDWKANSAQVTAMRISIIGGIRTCVKESSQLVKSKEEEEEGNPCTKHLSPSLVYSYLGYA